MGTLADGYATSLVTGALVLSRDGTMDASDQKALLPEVRELQHVALDAPASLRRWEPWVRASVVQTALQEGLRFTPQQPDTVTVAVAGGATPLVTITRPSIDFLKQQLPLVQSWAELREERAAEILAQIDEQFAFFAAITGLHPGRHRWTFEWLGVALQLAVAVEMRLKHMLACPRPVHLSPQVQPLITTPLHGTYPMGHATQAYLIAHCLQRVLGWSDDHPGTAQMQRLAARISVNRIVAGVHFPVDAWAGQRLGQTLGEYVTARSGFPHPCVARTIEPTSLSDPAADFAPGDAPLGMGHAKDTRWPVEADPLVHALACLARSEWEAPTIPQVKLP